MGENKNHSHRDLLAQRRSLAKGGDETLKRHNPLFIRMLAGSLILSLIKVS